MIPRFEDLYTIVRDHTSRRTGIRCAICDHVSWNSSDVMARYCGFCHRHLENYIRPMSEGRAEKIWSRIKAKIGR